MSFRYDDFTAIMLNGWISTLDASGGTCPVLIPVSTLGNLCNEEKVIYEYVTAQMIDDVSGKVFVDSTYDFDGSTQAGILFRLRGKEESNFFTPKYSSVVDFFCYGGSDTPLVSKELYIKLFNRLHGKTNLQLTDGFIVSIKNVVKGQLVIDPEIEWTYCISSFEFVIRKNN